MSGGSRSGGGLRRGKTRRSAADQGEPIDLDMTPMMNMLIILISFLVTMVVFTQLAVIKFTLPSSEAGSGAAADTAAAPIEQEVDITLVVTESGFQIVGEGRKLDPIPKGPSGYDYSRLGESMGKLHVEFPLAQSVVMLIDTSVVYQDIVTAMDVCRENKFPNILLSGGVYE